MPDILDRFASPLALFLTRNERVYWLYLLSAFAIAYFLFLRRKQEHAETGKNALAVIFPKAILWHRSSRNDYLYFYADMLLQGSFFVALFSSLSFVVSFYAETNLYELAPAFKGKLRDIGGMTLLTTVFFAAAADFALYLSHWLQHKIPWLWEFHKVHHSAEVMTPLTVFRVHPVDNLLAFSLGGLFSGMAFGLASFFIDHDFKYYNFAGVNVILIVFYLCGYNLRHSHIWWSFGPILDRILISPAQHQIHHSSAPEHFDKNIGFTFACWDAMFGTLYVPKAKETLSFGLGTGENETFSTFWSLYLMPFINLFRKFRIAMLLEPKRYASAMVFFIVVLPSVYWGQFATRPVKAPANRFLEDMTWQEVRDAVRQGDTRVLVPTGGTEQNGPHAVLGKHNYIVQYTAGRIAEALGHTLVAPVIRYVPEGAVSPPDGHMRFAGTLSVAEPEFEAILESAAKSLKQHGFETIAFIGDSAGNQDAQKRVAERLSEIWRSEGVRVLHVGDYYEHNRQSAYLLELGFTPAQIGGHAGIRDTSELMAVRPDGVREEHRGDHTHGDSVTSGADGDAGKASVMLGKSLLDLKIDAAVRQIRAALGE
ncbi:MAG: creatininase family protein [Gammaproteobacteria bacterium]